MTAPTHVNVRLEKALVTALRQACFKDNDEPTWTPRQNLLERHIANTICVEAAIRASLVERELLTKGGR